ncbi:phosphatidylinositol-4- kinase, partial [Tilletia horrida]
MREDHAARGAAAGAGPAAAAAAAAAHHICAPGRRPPNFTFTFAFTFTFTFNPLHLDCALDSLDLPTSQLILNALALNLAQEAGAAKLSPNDAAFLRSNATFSSASSSAHPLQLLRPPLRLPAAGFADGATARYLTAPAVRTHISLALFASSISSAASSANADQYLEPVLQHLVSLLADLTNAEFEHSLAWANWPLPDQISYALVSALLQIGNNAQQHRTTALDAVITFANSVAQSLTVAQGDAHVLITKHVPLLHGLYRALKDISFPWSLSEFARLATSLGPLSGGIQTTRRLNDALLDAAKAQDVRATRRKACGPAAAAIEEDDETRSIASNDTFDAEGLGHLDAEDGGFVYPEETGPQEQLLRNYRQALLSHYRRSDRPLSGHFILYGALDALSNVLAQAIKDVDDPAKAGLDTERGADQPASTGLRLLKSIPVVGTTLSNAVDGNSGIHRAYHDLQPFVETEGDKQTELFLDIYSLDTHVLLRVRILRSEQTFLPDKLLSGLALETVSLLVREYPSIAIPMTTQLRRFITSPFLIFEIDPASGVSKSPIVDATARCLVKCVKSVQGDDLVISTMYSLLNYLGRESSSAGGASAAVTGSAGVVTAIAALLAHDDLKPQENASTETIALFRNIWFLAVLFGHATPQHAVLPPGRPLVPLEGGEKVEQTLPSTLRKPEARAEVLANAFRNIARKTPTLVPEKALNYLESDLEYNSVLRRDFSQSTLEAQRKALVSVIPAHAVEARSSSAAQVTFLMTTYILENMRSAMGQPSMILWYFVNDGLNSSALVGSFEDIADKVIVNFIQHLSAQINDHALDPRVSFEVKNLLLGSCHRVAKVRQVSRSFLDKLVGALPSLLCDPDIVTTMLEMLTLLRHSCECEYRDEYTPKYRFESRRAKINFELSDNYIERDEILTDFLKRTKSYLSTLMGRAPVELRGILQLYLGTFDESALPGNAELGKSVAVDFARLMPASARQETFLPKYGGWRSDASSSFVDELTAKSTYLGEMTGVHLTLTKGLMEMQRDPARSFSERSVAECKLQLLQVSENLIRQKTLPFAEFRRLLYRTAALAVALPQPDYTLLAFVVAIPIRVFTPAAITTASHVWTWIIGERPEVETKIMVEITVGWSSTVKLRRGIFSDTLTNTHPLLRKTEMSPFNRAEVEAELELAHKMFMPHLTLIQLMTSRYQAFRYRDPTTVLALVRLIQRCAAATKEMSSHPLAREARFSLIIFGFRLLQGSRLDGLVEYELRAALYKMAFAWFAVAPQWSFGSNYLQVRTEMQLMTESLEVLKLDKVRASYLITSYPSSFTGVRLPGQMTVQASAKLFNERRALLQLLLESELSRFSVWANPLHLPARGGDYLGELTKTMTDPLWQQMVHIAWKVDPCLAVQLPSRFKAPIIKHEVGMLVRAQPQKALEAPGAVEILLEDHLRSANRDGTDLKWLHYWAPVTPVEAIQLFQPLYENHPMVLQYGMRTLEQHPVQLVFFYVPQVVQALRDDKYGYVEQFIFETSKISQLFCHQIIWNMKANSYKDGDAEVEDPLKPTLDRVQDQIVRSLSGEARSFYEREFTFFNEVTGISGKLKPYIKKSKLEKKAKIDEEMAKIKVDKGVYLPSNPDGIVVDLDRKSGRPLQSHAKAPYMATFKVHRDVVKPHPAEQAGESIADETGGAVNKQGVDVWQSAIFKVGDDCRQDVLALQ